MSDHEPLPVAEARAGQAEAWEVLFKRYQLPLYAYVFELVRNEQQALDIVQETFVNAVRYLQALSSDEKFGSWLFSIAHQKCAQQWRKRDRALAESEEALAELEDPTLFPDQVLIREEEEQAFMNAIAQLDPPQRSAILLHFFEGWSIEEIAGITSAAPGTVKSRLHYARKALKKFFQEVQT